MLIPVSAGVPSLGGEQGKPCACRVRQARRLVVGAFGLIFSIPLRAIMSRWGLFIRSYTF